MRMCAGHPKTIFIGQGVGVPGTTMSPTLDGINPAKRIEFPVAEDLQMGAAIGMALDGVIPICIFPRWNFVLCAGNQIVNHLDRLSLYSDGGYNPIVLIRTAVPSSEPFDPGPQHDDDFVAPFRLMLRTVDVVQLTAEDHILPAYMSALNSAKSTILVEYTEAYKNERGKAAAQ